MVQKEKSKMRLVQFLGEDNQFRVAVTSDDGKCRVVSGVSRVLDLAHQALVKRTTIAVMAEQLAGASVDLETLDRAGRLRPPVDHAEPSRCWVTGTGLTHLGSARARNNMHEKSADPAPSVPPTDSMRMFQWGVEGGKPSPGTAGVSPEWFYKGNGHSVVAPGQTLVSPGFAEDMGDEAEVAGVYLIGPDGTPHRLGFVIGNELSDHVTERKNYLYLAHSKIRPCAIGPELLLGDLPRDVEGMVRVLRLGEAVFESAFRSGEDNMAHSLANLEHHHFKYPLFRTPGDLHIHFFGADVLSFSAGFRTQAGDTIEVSAKGFGRPLQNPVALAKTNPFVMVSPL
jgi:hypothetical protein